MELLELVPDDDKRERLVTALADPRRAGDSLQTIAKDLRITPREILALFRDASMAKAYTEAHMKIAEKLPRVAESVADAAITQVTECECVKVSGEVDPECKLCKGKGRLLVKGSLPHQQMMLEAAGVLKRGGGVQVQVQQGVVIGGSGGFFDKFVKATDDIGSVREVIDGETIERVAEGEAVGTKVEGEAVSESGS